MGTSEEAIKNIDDGLEAASCITIEESLGHAVLTGIMTAEEALWCLDAYEKSLTNGKINRD